MGFRAIHHVEKDQLPSSLMDRFLLRINEWIEELRMKGLWSILYYLVRSIKSFSTVSSSVSVSVVVVDIDSD